MDAYQSYRSIESNNSETMDAEQRYTEEANFHFEEGAYDKLLKLGNIGYNLAISIHNTAHRLKKKQGIIQNYAVMVEGEIPFEIWILNQHDDSPVLVDVERIDIDRYLDMMNSLKSITHEIKKESANEASGDLDRDNQGDN